MIQIANGIKYLNQLGIVYRDLKPSNIMITKQNNFGIIKIADFGISKIISPTERTKDGVGTLAYISPEILKRTPYNQKVDIWAMGVILYQILSDTLPFTRENDNDLAKKIAFEELKFDKNDWENRTQSVQDLIKCCLNKSQERRISIDDFINLPWFKKNKIIKLSI